jgi:putative transposase
VATLGRNFSEIKSLHGHWNRLNPESFAQLTNSTPTVNHAVLALSLSLRASSNPKQRRSQESRGEHLRHSVNVTNVKTSLDRQSDQGHPAARYSFETHSHRPLHPVANFAYSQRLPFCRNFAILVQFGAAMPQRSLLPLPKDWPSRVKSAVLGSVSLATFIITQTRSRVQLAGNPLEQLQAANERLQQEIHLLREELRVKDARMAQVTPHKRPQYPPLDRMAILELRAARAWSLTETARIFQVTAATIGSWLLRMDEQSDRPLVGNSTPVHKFPQHVRYLVQRLKVLCPTLGKAKIAQVLARAGLHLGATTIGRVMHEAPIFPNVNEAHRPEVHITANRPNQVWHVDLTTVPTNKGFWAAWFPFALLQRWPFGWWQLVVVDQYSRRVMAMATFEKQPTSLDVQESLRCGIRKAKAKPATIICDKGPQFWCEGFKSWCQRRHIQLRYGAVGKHGSITVVERFIRTLKELLRQTMVSFDKSEHQAELDLIVNWYNEHRPHEYLNGATPDEIYHRHFPQHRKPRYEPRNQWPHGSPCAKPWALVRGKPGAKLTLEVTYLGGKRHLPVVALGRVA